MSEKKREKNKTSFSFIKSLATARIRLETTLPNSIITKLFLVSGRPAKQSKNFIVQDP